VLSNSERDEKKGEQSIMEAGKARKQFLKGLRQMLGSN